MIISGGVAIVLESLEIVGIGGKPGEDVTEPPGEGGAIGRGGRVQARGIEFREDETVDEVGT